MPHGQILAMAPAVQQTLDAITGRRLLLDIVVGQPGQAGWMGCAGVSKNARFLDTMTMIPITYGYARVSKADDDSKNLETQLRDLAAHGIRRDLIFTDTASGRTMNRPGWQDLMSRVQPGDTVVGSLPGPVQPQL